MPSQFQLVLDSLVALRAVLLAEDEMAVARKLEGELIVLLNLEHRKVKRVLSKMVGARWKNVLSTTWSYAIYNLFYLLDWFSFALVGSGVGTRGRYHRN